MRSSIERKIGLTFLGLVVLGLFLIVLSVILSGSFFGGDESYNVMYVFINHPIVSNVYFAIVSFCIVFFLACLNKVKYADMLSIVVISILGLWFLTRAVLALF